MEIPQTQKCYVLLKKIDIANYSKNHVKEQNCKVSVKSLEHSTEAGMEIPRTKKCYVLLEKMDIVNYSKNGKEQNCKESLKSLEHSAEADLSSSLNNRKNVKFKRKFYSPPVLIDNKTILEQQQLEYVAAYIEVRSTMQLHDSENFPAYEDALICNNSSESRSILKRQISAEQESDLSEKSILPYSFQHISSDDSEEAASDTTLASVENDPTYTLRQGYTRRKPAVKNAEIIAAKKKKTVPEEKTLSAYMLWYTENRKKIAASFGNVEFGSIGKKKMIQAWQALPGKEKMAWGRKAERLSLKSKENATNTRPNGAANIASSRTNKDMADKLLKGLSEPESTKFTPVDVAAHLKSLGNYLSILGQRVFEHKDELSETKVISVLLDALLSTVPPLLSLVSEISSFAKAD